MQINRYEHDAHIYTDPHGNRPASVTGAGLQGAHAKFGGSNAAEGKLNPLRNALQQIPESRSDAIERARQKVASGEYLTPSAAKQLAGSDLRNEFFTTRP